jgi:predicted dehydrogenase
MSATSEPQVLRIGLLGAARIAPAAICIPALALNHKLVAVGARDLQKSEVFAQQWMIEKAYGSYEELVADPTIDGIYVATPHPMHHANTILALNAGKPVLCEKVFSINAREAKEMIDCAKKNNVMVMEAMWARFVPHMIKVREIIASGVLGEIISVQADHGQRLADYGNDRHWKPELGGGALLDLGIYTASFIHMVLGVPQKITATAALTEHGVDNSCSAIFD